MNDFNPYKVERWAALNENNKDMVSASNYDELLKLYEECRKYASLESYSRKYWSVRCEEYRRAFLSYIAAENGHFGKPTQGDIQELENILKNVSGESI